LRVTAFIRRQELRLNNASAHSKEDARASLMLQYLSISSDVFSLYNSPSSLGRDRVFEREEIRAYVELLGRKLRDTNPFLPFMLYTWTTESIT